MLLLVWLVGAGLAGAQPSVRGWTGTVRVEALNLRAGPGEGHDIVGQLGLGDTFVAVDESGSWVRLQGLEPAWLHRRWVHLPEDFMAPGLDEKRNAFLDWVAERQDLSELSLDDDNRLSIILADPGKPERAAEVATEIGCAYREQTGYEPAVTVTVWPATGPGDGWIAQSICP